MSHHYETQHGQPHHGQPPPPPPSLPPPQEDNLPPDVDKYFDKNRNRPYYYNRVTKETLWTLPSPAQHLSQPPPPPTPYRPHQGSQQWPAQPPLQPSQSYPTQPQYSQQPNIYSQYQQPSDAYPAQQPVHQHLQQHQQPPDAYPVVQASTQQQTQNPPATYPNQQPLQHQPSSRPPDSYPGQAPPHQPPSAQPPDAYSVQAPVHQQPPTRPLDSYPGQPSIHHQLSSQHQQHPSNLQHQYAQGQQHPQHSPPQVNDVHTSANYPPNTFTESNQNSSYPPEPHASRPPSYPAATGSSAQPAMTQNQSYMQNLISPGSNNSISQPSLPAAQHGESLYNIATSISFLQSNGPDNAAVFIELELRAIGLRKRDFIGTSDPICYVQVPVRRTITVNKQTKWRTVGKTEALKNTTEPNWAKRIRLPYLFEEHQPLRFFLIDVDNWKTERGDTLGMCETTMAEVVRNSAQTIPLLSSQSQAGKFGKLIVRAHDENANGQVRLDLSLAAKGLQNVEFLGKSDPFYTVSCVIPGGGPASVLGSSERVDNNLNPRWEPLRVTIATGGHSWNLIELTFTVYDHNNKKSHRKIGQVSVSLDVLLKTKSLELRNPQLKRKKATGELIITEAKASDIPNFISFIQGGLRLKFVVAVDFTASNKPVNQPSSLHYIGDAYHPSVYAEALHAVGSVISGYIPDKWITALGFGAKLPGHQEAAFDFSLTGEKDARVFGVDGLLAAYKKATTVVSLSGPTLFTPIIRHVMKFCETDRVTQENQNFTVLMILTDGIITDLTETIDAIIDASYKSPVSIVIVGVGDADFSAMKFLDSDEQKLRSASNRNKVAKHDIVQFTKYEKSQSLDSLAAEVLHEVPKQLVEYMMSENITPKEPVEDSP